MKGGKSKAESKKAGSKLSVKGTAAKASKKGKAAKDPSKPKRPASAFFVFMEEFRVQYKQKHPNNKSVAVVGKAGGDKWKSMPEAEKAPYIQKADKRKAEYERNMKAYNKKQSEGKNAEEEESDRSRSEVNDEEEDEEGSDQKWALFFGVEKLFSLVLFDLRNSVPVLPKDISDVHGLSFWAVSANSSFPNSSGQYQ
ncbi:hypothetical protein Nepgr_020743 [Nepenthes gracilis]|uniref:HMG box domain-containing protein n=1 Tax=Nepenthes gracilis TaxID=150966 RepID=A0AAD3SYJ4_NEPGR|nr:hypothetical protein Nepgr_020743 [Nepenthes gracilis]